GVRCGDGIASQQRGGNLPRRRLFFARLDEGSLQVLVAEADDRRQGGGTAGTTGFSVNEVHRRALEYSLSEQRTPQTVGTGNKSGRWPRSLRMRSRVLPELSVARTG